VFDKFLGFVKAVNPFSSRMPEDLQHEFLDECADGFVQYDANGDFVKGIMPYSLFVVLAKK